MALKVPCHADLDAVVQALREQLDGVLQEGDRAAVRQAWEVLVLAEGVD